MARIKKKVKPPSGGVARVLSPLTSFNPNDSHSVEAHICTGCQQSDLYWAWDFRSKKRILVDKTNSWHMCPTPQTEDVFPGWCEKCAAPDLLLIHKQKSFELTENYGLPHTCEQGPENIIEEMSKAKCKFCNNDELFWVMINFKWKLKHSNGVAHKCAAYDPYMKDWAEAKRINYAMEKDWIKSHPDDHKCKKCDGTGTTSFLSKNKRTMRKYLSSEPIRVYRPCKCCKRIGTFSMSHKKDYLKQLRKKYWPWKQGFHKWKKADGL